MSNIIIKNLTTVADSISEKKYIFLLENYIFVAYKQEDYELLSEICEELLKLNNRFSKHQGFELDFYHCGFLANFKLNRFENAYIYFRKIAKQLLEVIKAVEKIENLTGIKPKSRVFDPEVIATLDP